MAGWLAGQFDTGSLMRRLVLVWAMVMVTLVLNWSVEFATSNPASVNTALIIGAIGAPLNIMLGHIFSQYTKGRAEK